MSPKQAERLRKQVADVKRFLAAEKRKFGAYDDSPGYRYFPPKCFVQLGDYAGGLRYVRWFDKNFPDDIGYPDFLLEWTILLFKNARLKEAERKAIQTYCSNTYLFDQFFGRPIVPLAKWEGSNVETPAQARLLPYSSSQPALLDFADWLSGFLATARFSAFSAEYLRLSRELRAATEYPARRALVEALRALETGF